MLVAESVRIPAFELSVGLPSVQLDPLSYLADILH
jgi:hypothetical protein